MVSHARDAAPAECCGLLLGHGRTISEACRARNIADLQTRFLIHPEDHINVRRDARRRGLEVVGFYHSHPHSPATPSDIDRAEAGYERHLYLIVSLASDVPDVRVFMLENASFVEQTWR